LAGFYFKNFNLSTLISALYFLSLCLSFLLSFFLFFLSVFRFSCFFGGRKKNPSTSIRKDPKQKACFQFSLFVLFIFRASRDIRLKRALRKYRGSYVEKRTKETSRWKRSRLPAKPKALIGAKNRGPMHHGRSTGDFGCNKSCARDPSEAGSSARPLLLPQIPEISNFGDFNQGLGISPKSSIVVYRFYTKFIVYTTSVQQSIVKIRLEKVGHIL
jgi:hypothetical protein